jgi:hypothetical protein
MFWVLAMLSIFWLARLATTLDGHERVVSPALLIHGCTV